MTNTRYLLTRDSKHWRVLIEMVVSIELFGMQREIAKIDRIRMPISGQTAVRDALEYVRTNYPLLTLNNESVFITVNHEIATMDRLLKPNDAICILPHIGGG